jgi:hypothetical protein
MAAAETSAPDRRGWNALAVGLLVLYFVSLGIFFVAALMQRQLATPLVHPYTDPTSWWAILIHIGLGAGAFLAYYWPRRRETRSFSLLLTTGLAVTTLFLGLASYWHCPKGGVQSSFWGALTGALNLFVGNTPDCQADDYAHPLAEQVARLSGLLLLAIAALGIAATVFRAQADRLQVRFARALVVLVGLTDESIGLLRRLSAERDSRTTLAVLVEDAGNPLIKMARDLGAKVAFCDIDDPPTLRTLLTAQARFSVRALYAVSADVSVNLRWTSQFRAIADSTKPSTSDMPPRMIVRIDDPWEAEYWRRTNAYRTGERGKSASVRWMSDALSVYEVTAALILDRILTGSYDRLVLVGSSPLALAVCAELAQREREGALLKARPKPSFPQLLMFGPDAEALRQQHRLRQERFGNSADWDLITVVSKEPTSENLRERLRDDRQPALILADDPGQSAPALATFMSALNPGWTIFDWSTSTRGVAAEPVMEKLYPFGLTTETASGRPVDSWERAARVVHENYRLVHVPHPDPAVPSHRAWDDGLEPFLKESNVRLVTTTLASAEFVGRSWGPSAAAPQPPDADQLDRMAQLEHASWLKHHVDNGWHYGAKRSDSKKLHPALVPWNLLDPASQEKTRQNVLAALRTLEGLGYRSTPAGGAAPPPASAAALINGARAAGGDPTAWIRVARTGEVTASVVDEPWTWTSAAGDVLQAKPGNWRVSNAAGDVWSVAAEVFHTTHRHIAGNRWRRIGEVKARPAIEGEVVESLEGHECARAGDWVMEGPAGERWVTSAAYFSAHYSRI